MGKEKWQMTNGGWQMADDRPALTKVIQFLGRSTGHGLKTRSLLQWARRQKDYWCQFLFRRNEI